MNENYFTVKHTTASLIMCENWDKEVRADMKMILDKIVPEVGSLYVYIYIY